MKIKEVEPFKMDKGFLERYLKNSNNQYIYGGTKEATDLLKVLPCNFIIDDFSEEIEFCGKPIVKIDEVPLNASVISAVTRRPITIHNKLENLGIDHTSYYFLLYNENLKLPTIRYWEEAKGHFNDNISRYENLYNNLIDEVSKNTLEDIISFRETGNLAIMKNYKSRFHEMYFEDFIKLKENANFYDIGVLDGFNSDIFIQKYNYGEILMIEPMPSSYNALLQKYSKNDRIKITQCAVSNNTGEAEFYINIEDPSQASLINSSTANKIKIRLETIDQLYEKSKIKPDFIKMDIEGAEIKALMGALNVIKKIKPTLAISVYHDANHILEAFELLQKSTPEYKFYMRHYTEGYTETVLFATI
jgi:FkbM family methyltransferase